MGEVKQFKLPDLGEGLTEGDLLKWLVAVGDTVAVNDSIAEVETVKAAVELPSPFAGVVTALHAAEGETVPVGAPIISIDVAPGSGDGASTGDAASAAAEEPEPTLVGYGPHEGAGRRRRRRPQIPVPSAHTAFNIPPSAQSLDPGAEPPGPVQPAPAAGTEPAPAAAARARAKPPVRKLAKTLGVDLAAVPATGPNGTVSRDDVQAAAGRAESSAVEPGARETRVPVKGVRKHTAAAMVASAFTAPHVTEFVTVDVTAMMQLRDRVAARPEFRDVKVSPLLFLAKAVILAVRRTPEINATWDEPAGEIVYKHYVNLGIAAATDRGLIVPNIKDADRLPLLDLAQALAALTETARAGRTPPADMTGGTITITNVGVFGVDTGTPILNPGEAGIVAFGAVRRMPWVVGTGDGERIEPRWVTQLAVSFDHRLVDGQQGSRFLADVAAVLSDPGMALL
jgi:pyruvate dehydrogenase E2 component (dihydrolipoamide acetyltransferase)